MQEAFCWLSFSVWFGIGGRSCSNFLAATVGLELRVRVSVFIFSQAFSYGLATVILPCCENDMSALTVVANNVRNGTYQHVGQRRSLLG